MSVCASGSVRGESVCDGECGERMGESVCESKECV